MPFVSREEMEAHLVPMKDDIAEIKSDVKTLVEAKYSNSFFGGRGHAFMVALIPAVIAAIVAALFTYL